MSMIHFKYHNAVDGGTVAVFSSQITTLPATNVQNGIKSKVWRTEDDFIVTARNNVLPFHNEKTSVALAYTIPAAVYTGATLAAKIQSGLNETGDYTDHYCTYADSKFSLWRSSTSNGFFRLSFDDPTYKDDTVAVLLGFDHATGYNSPDRIYTSTVATLGNEHQLEIDLSATQTVSAFIVDGHNLTEAGTMILRAATQTGLLSGPYNQAEGIALSTTVTVTEDIISLEPDAPEIIVGGDCEGNPTEFIDNGDCEGGAVWREMMDRGDCESTTAPMVLNETVAPIVADMTWARSAEQAKAGTYSFKLTKTAVDVTTRTAGLTDSITATTDLHGVIPGRTYSFSAWMYVPTGTTPTQCSFIMSYYDSAAWVTITGLTASINDDWENVLQWVNIPATATGFHIYARLDGAADNGDNFYIDVVELQEVALPIIRGDSESVFSNCKLELSSVQANGGTYSLKLIKTSAGGAGTGVYYIHDALDIADLRGITAGRWYKFQIDVYIPSSGGPQASEVTIQIGQYYSAAWTYTTAVATGQDAWETVTIILKANSAIAGLYLRTLINTAASVNEFFYIDNISFKELTPPMVRGGTTPAFGKASGTFSAVQAAAGTYSLKLVKNSAPGSLGYMTLTDSQSTANLNGFVPGTTIILSAKVYVPSGSILGTEVNVRVYESISGATVAATLTLTGVNTYNAFQTLSGSVTLNAKATGVFIRLELASAAAIGEFVYFDTVSVTGPKLYKTLQLYWHDRTLDKSEIGRFWAGEYFEPAGKQTNTISYIKRTQKNRSTVMVTQSGAAYFNKQQRLKEWLIDVDPLDQFYNNTTKEGYEDMLDEVENHTPFYISFEDNLYSSTVYGYLTGDNVFTRNKNTPMFYLKDLVFREQK